LHLHLRSLPAATLLVFAGTIGLGALTFLPLGLDRVELGSADAPRGMPWARTELQSKPAAPAKVSAPAAPEKVSAVEGGAEQRSSKAEQTGRQALTFSQRTPAPEHGSGATSAFAQEPQGLRPSTPVLPSNTAAKEEEQVQAVEPKAVLPAGSTPQATATPLVTQSPTHADRHVVRPKHTASKNAEKPKQAAKHLAEKRAKEAKRVVRTFDDKLRDVPVSAYAGDGNPRTIVIRPTSIQDYYYYSSRR
jgi:hypothetical protein